MTKINIKFYKNKTGRPSKEKFEHAHVPLSSRSEIIHRKTEVEIALLHLDRS